MLLLGTLGLFPAAPASAQVTAPSVPQNVQITAGDNKLILTWEAPSSWGTWDKSGFEIATNHDPAWPLLIDKHWLAEGSWYKTRFEWVNGLYTNIEAPKNGTSVSMRIRAVSLKPGGSYLVQGDKSYSGWVTVTATPMAATTVPGQVGSLTATGGDGKFDLRWTKPAEEVTSYEIEVTSATTTTVADSAAAGGTTFATGWRPRTRDSGPDFKGKLKTFYTESSVSNGTAYRVRVRGVNSAGNGAWSFVTVTPAATSSSTAQWSRSSVIVRETDADQRETLDIVLSKALTNAVVLGVSQTSGSATSSGSSADWEKLSDAACVTGASGATSLSCTIVARATTLPRPTRLPI